MDLRQDWIDSEIIIRYRYRIICDKCGQEVIFTQNGPQFIKSDLDIIMNKVHCEENLDALHYSIPGSVLVDIDIEKNSLCQSKSKNENFFPTCSDSLLVD